MDDECADIIQPGTHSDLQGSTTVLYTPFCGVRYCRTLTKEKYNDTMCCMWNDVL